MPKKRRLVLCAVSALLLLLACGAAAAEEAVAAPDEAAAFLFRNGVTWEMSIDEIAQAEGLAGASGFFVAQAAHYTSYTLQGALEAQVPATLSYYMKENQLAAVWCDFVFMPGFDFEAWCVHYTQEYGEPTETERKTVADLFNAITPGALEEDEISQMAGWLLSDGTRIYMLDLEGDLMLFCFNAPVLLN